MDSSLLYLSIHVLLVWIGSCGDKQEASKARLFDCRCEMVCEKVCKNRFLQTFLQTFQFCKTLSDKCQQFFFLNKYCFLWVQSKGDPRLTTETLEFNTRAQARHESMNSRIKAYDCLNQRWRHPCCKHRSVFMAIVCLTNIQLKFEPLFDWTDVKWHCFCSRARKNLSAPTTGAKWWLIYMHSSTYWC